MVHYFDPPLNPRKRSAAKGERHDPESGGEDDAGDDDGFDNAEDVAGKREFFKHLADVEKHEEEERKDTDSKRYLTVRQQYNVKRQHFIVLNTILHKCLLDHDFTRAGRAFGMLLRFDMGGSRIDLRKKALWGIGAEVMLRRECDVPRTNISSSIGSNVSKSNDELLTADVDNKLFSNEGFEAAKAYYERLILQFPYNRRRPQDVSSRHFYPAMFGLWIFQVQTQRQRLAVAAESRRDSSPESFLMSSDQDQNVDISALNAKERRLRKIRIQELKQARSIARRLETVIFLPPFDRDLQLLKLRGMLGLWIADLMYASSTQPQSEVDAQRKVALAYLQRAKIAGWKGGEGDSHLMKQDAEVMSEDW